MAHLGRTLGDGIERAKCGHHGPGGEHFDRHPSAAHGSDALGQSFGTRAQTGEFFWPGGDHAPFGALLDRGRCGSTLWFIGFKYGGSAGRAQYEASGSAGKEIAAVHEATFLF